MLKLYKNKIRVIFSNGASFQTFLINKGAIKLSNILKTHKTWGQLYKVKSNLKI